jgi:predicted TIM-barrel fold metal-dependent hydrolase
MPRNSGLLLIVLLLLVACVGLAWFVHRQKRKFQPPGFDRVSVAEFASLDPIDAHTHILETGPAFVGMLDRLHLHVLDILYVDDTTPYFASLQQEKKAVLKFVSLAAGRAQICTTFDPFRFNDPRFAEDATAGLDQDFAQGAVAVKIWKNIGMEIKTASGQYLMPDDPVFQPIYRDIVAHNKTLITHVADPDLAWGLQGQYGFKTNYYQVNPQWDISKKTGAPAKAAILQARDHVLALNPQLRVVGAHLGSMEDDVDALGATLDRYPNFAVDTAARVKRLVLQPRDRVRAFMLKYQGRILYGTDLNFYPGTDAPQVAWRWETQYALDWRYFATDDTFEYQGQKVQGLGLPRSVLKMLYHDNAVRWIPGIIPSPSSASAR